MSDIDFDELDRAVASVLSSDETKQDQPAAEPASEPVVAPAPEALLESGLEPENEVSAEPEPTPSPQPEQSKPAAVSAQDLHPVAQKPVQRGRFLDMVHPAHDMAPRSTAPSLNPAARGGASVAQAANQTFVSDVVAPAPAPVVEPSVEPAVMTPIAPEPTPEVTAPEPEHDPADFFAGTPVDEQKTDEPTPSPFIPDAKVEKRPLGAFNSGETVQGSSPLPVGDELHDKLVQVESEDNVIETAESPIPTKFESAKAVPKKTDGKPTVVSPISVSQPSPAIVNVAPTSTPKPRAAKAPKHGKGTVIWITVAIAVILIGFGVGATLYFIVLK